MSSEVIPCNADDVITPSEPESNQDDDFDYFTHYREKKANANGNKTNSPMDPWKNEVSKYLQTKVIDIKEDPMVWWQQNKHVFPNMFKLATKLLPCPASSIESERIFSIGSQIYTPKRNRIASKTAERLMYLNYNLRFMKANNATYEFELVQKK